MRVMIVEDNVELAATLQLMLEDLGHEVEHQVSTMRDGLEAAQWTSAEVSILDVNIDGVLSMPVAHRLRDRSIPIVFMTGHSEVGIEQAFRSCPLLIKPFKLSQLRAALNLRYC